MIPTNYYLIMSALLSWAGSAGCSFSRQHQHHIHGIEVDAERRQFWRL